MTLEINVNTSCQAMHVYTEGGEWLCFQVKDMNRLLVNVPSHFQLSGGVTSSNSTYRPSRPEIQNTHEIEYCPFKGRRVSRTSRLKPEVYTLSLKNITESHVNSKP